MNDSSVSKLLETANISGRTVAAGGRKIQNKVYRSSRGRGRVRGCRGRDEVGRGTDLHYRTAKMLPQQYCLRWKYHHSNLQTMFSQLLDRGCFCDVTLACEGQLLRAHRVVLCACSTFFDTLLTNYGSDRDPIIIMKDVTFADIKCLIEFMYKGEINVEHVRIESFCYPLHPFYHHLFDFPLVVLGEFSLSLKNGR